MSNLRTVTEPREAELAMLIASLKELFDIGEVTVEHIRWFVHDISKMDRDRFIEEKYASRVREEYEERHI